ncbi:IS1 family transposase [Geitlerinema sp. CS-897]|nr:IS1 family transposase [Geitlerinema sp. CS-897]
MDELWSFGGRKPVKQWVGLALNAETREIVGVYLGARDREAARKLWESLPPVYRQCATCYTDLWESYQTVLPSKRHKAVEKNSKKTVILKDLTILFVSVCLDSFVKLYL